MKTVPSARRYRWTSDIWKATVIPFLLFLAIPILALILRIQPASVVESFRLPQVQQAIVLSLRTSLITVLVSVMLGTPVAYYLSHRHYRFHRLVDTLIDLPLVLPPAVAGVALLVAFGRRGLLGPAFEAFGVTIPFTQAAVVMAQTFVAASLYIKAAALGFAAIDCELKKSALLDGANRWQVFRYLTIPMMMPVLLTVVFIRLMDALRIVDEVYMLTNGGPGTATQFIGIHIYRVVVPKTDYGYGSAMSLLVLYFTIVLCWLLFIALAQVGKQRE